ncbi:MAG: CheR family methyltransferase [Anaerolineales bacterium]
MAEKTNRQEFEELLQFIRDRRGFDFTGYKRNSLHRGINKRMEEVEIDDYAHYSDYLEAHPGEFVDLFNTILINVTSFFRDAETWDYLRDSIIPMLEERHENGPMRVWSAACSSGQEPISIAMAFAEVFGLESLHDRVKIYATDVDEEALAKARRGLYSEDELESIPKELRKQYFLDEGDLFRVDPQIRRLIIYGVHNLVSDPPISHLNLLVCRNTVIFFNKELQREIASRFHFALDPEGVLFLGKAEALISKDRLFKPIHLKHRFYSPIETDDVGEQLEAVARVGGRTLPEGLVERVDFYEMHLNHHPVPEMIVDREGILILANQEAKAQFDIGNGAIGEPFSSLEVSFRPINLRSMIERALAEGSTQIAPEIRNEREGDDSFLTIHVVPLKEDDGVIAGVLISFRDVTNCVELRRKYVRANEKLESAYEDIQSTNEEIETTNEELHSTIEELETTNEELQSTNEEMETMNEELESSNEELRFTNLELQRRTDELNRTNAFLNSVLRSLKSALIVVDKNMEITAWNEEAYELWGVTTDEVKGRHLTELDIGLPVKDLEEPVSHFLSKGQTDQEMVQLEARNRKGQPILCNIIVAPLIDAQEDMSGALLLVEVERLEG